MKKIHSASTSHQPQATSGDIVIEIPAQRRNDASTPRIDSPLSSLPPRPSGRRNSTGSDSGYETDNEADLSPYGSLRLHASLRGKRAAASGSMTLKTPWNHQLHRPRNTLHNMAPKRMHPPLRQALRA